MSMRTPAKRTSYKFGPRYGSKPKNNLSKQGGNHRRLVLLNLLFTLSLAGMIVATIAGVGVVAYFSRDLPNPNRLLERSFELSTRFYDRDGQLLYELYGDKNRTLVKFDEISPNVVHATLAAEDANFYEHSGFYLLGMIRATRNIALGADLQSGSTLTQQVIKNTLLSTDQTLTRKIRELILSLQLENRYSKEEILQMYLNEAPYGGQNYGIYSGSKAYFNKHPKDLTLAESAYLAGLPQRPSYYSQFGGSPEAGLERKNYVLFLMYDKGWTGSDGKNYKITKEEYEAAKAEELNFEVSRVPLVAPHFIFYTKQYLIDKFGEDVVEQGGLQVTTTLNRSMYDLSQTIVREEVDKSKAQGLNLWNGAMVVIDPRNGEILSMIGSKGYDLAPEPEGCISGAADETGCKFDPYVNVATSLRQPGSAIKPITYANMLNQGYSVAYPFLDVPTKFEGSAPDKPYEPVNYDGMFRGVMSFRNSLANSLNITAVKALKIGGLDNMIDLAEKMGISTFTERARYGLALTLGGGETRLLELTGAYTVFASGGMYREPTPILEIRDSYGNVLYKPDSQGSRVLSEETAFLISDVLSDDSARSAAFGTGSLLNVPGHQVAVKTGTTDDKRDNYAMGYTKEVAVGVWVGNSNNERMNPAVASGISGATPIWSRFMKEYLQNKEASKFEAPANVKKFKVDRLTGMLPYDDFPTREEWFIDGQEPDVQSPWYQRLEVCEVDGRLANEECKDAGRTDQETFIKILAELPEWQAAVDAWTKENYDDDLYFPPQMRSNLEFDGDEVSNKDDVAVEIVGLKNGDSIPLEFRLNIEVSAYRDIDQVRIYMDGNKITEDPNEPFGYNFKLPASAIGKHTFEAVAEDEDGNKGDHKLELNVVGYQRD